MCTYRAVGSKYWKYTIDGTNIFLINMLGLVAFTIVNYFLLFETLHIETWFTSPGFNFILGLLSIIPLAYFIGQAVASISAQSSMGVGATINAFFSTVVDSGAELYKRKGGGGGRSGGGSSSSSSSGSSSGGRSGSGSSSSSSSSSSGSRTGGTGVVSSPRTFGGGSRYAGGASTPYRAGSTPAGWRGPSPLLLGAGVGALVLFPGLYLGGAYLYHHNNNDGRGDQRQTYYNQTSNMNETRPVECICAQDSQCGCSDDLFENKTTLNEFANNKQVSSVRNGTLFINGTLEEEQADSQSSAAGSFQQKLIEATGFWPVVAGVAYTMWFL